MSARRTTTRISSMVPQQDKKTTLRSWVKLFAFFGALNCTIEGGQLAWAWVDNLLANRRDSKAYLERKVSFLADNLARVEIKQEMYREWFKKA